MRKNLPLKMKKTITPKNLVLAAFLATSFLSNAQEQPKKFGKYPLTADSNGIIRCATVENELNLRDQNVKIATDVEFEKWISKKIEEVKAERLANPKSGNAVKVIPVVVHVIHNGDALGANENISLERIQTQIAVLNEDYSMAAGTRAENVWGIEAAVNTGIQFCLAKIDYNGQPFDGVDRVPLNTAVYTSRDLVEQTKSFTQWDPDSYFNIWTFNWEGLSSPGTLLGYAQFPSNSTLQGLSGGEASTDGVAIDYRAFGSREKMVGPIPSGTLYSFAELGRTATHEIGHALGLRHIWGDGDCTATDYCNDTPPQASETSGCPNAYISTCSSGTYDMWQNFMDYTNDSCMSVFTKDQRTRMETVLANSSRRKTLLTSNVCGTVGTVDFKMLQGINIYPNPAQTVINIASETELPDSYTVFNSLGQVVASAQNVSDANLAINVSSYANGIYFLKVDKGSESKTIKFIKN